MKIAISAMGPSLDADVDPRFGRCQYLIIVDPETMELEAVENTNIAASGGAGIATGQLVAAKGVELVLTGNCGPNAYQTLAAAGIQVITGVSGKVRDVIEGYKTGRFSATSQPTVEAHYGMGPGMGAGPSMGMGRGMGMGAGMVPPPGPSTQPPSPEQEIEALKTQSQMLKQQLDDIQRRIEELDKRRR